VGVSVALTCIAVATPLVGVVGGGNVNVAGVTSGVATLQPASKRIKSKVMIF
jgi:hypothetical protein